MGRPLRRHAAVSRAAPGLRAVSVRRRAVRHWHSTFVIDISDTFEQKLAAVRCYASQFDAARFDKVSHFVTGHAIANGSRCGFAYGELFALPHPVGASDLHALVHGGKGTPAPVPLPQDPAQPEQ